jgi:hypothetical protein
VTGKWIFSVDGNGRLAVQPPPDPAPPTEPILDWLSSDVGPNERSLDGYLELWAVAFDISGNGTAQTLDGDEVRFEALYEQWEDFRMPLATFEQILTDYREFLVRRAAERTAGTPPA